MKRTKILAHRGWWKTPDEKNSVQALKRALQAGYGIETDFRDANGNVVISHDPPEGKTLAAKVFFEFYAQMRVSGRLGLNIKADGLQTHLFELISNTRISFENVFVFDMSIPDGLKYLEKKEFAAYTRVSEFEENPSFIDRATGVWVDNFTGDYSQVAQANKYMAKGLRACIVSPELHGREHLALWDEIASSELHKNPLFELCTDLPQDAYDLLGTN